MNELLEMAKKIREVCKSSDTNCSGCPFHIPETEDYFASCAFDYDEPSEWVFPDEEQPF